MKKSALLLLFSLGASLFATDFKFSTGVLAGFTTNIDRGSTSDDSEYRHSFNYSAGYDILSVELFVDATYINLGFGFESLLRGYQDISIYGDWGNDLVYENDVTYDGTRLDFTASCYLKYPFGSDSILIYPMVGIKQTHNLTLSDADDNDLKEGMTEDEFESLNRVFIQFGIGFDITLSDHMFLRMNVVGGPKLRNDFELNLIANTPGLEIDSYTIIDAKLGIGYSF